MWQRNLQGKESVDMDQLEAALKLALDRQSMYYDDKAVADGLCRPKKEKGRKGKDLDCILYMLCCSTVCVALVKYIVYTMERNPSCT